jgi:hypothetical protein
MKIGLVVLAIIASQIACRSCEAKVKDAEEHYNRAERECIPAGIVRSRHTAQWNRGLRRIRRNALLLAPHL